MALVQEIKDGKVVDSSASQSKRQTRTASPTPMTRRCF